MTSTTGCRVPRSGVRHRNVEDAMRLDALVDGVLAGLPLERADVPRRMRELMDVVNLLASFRAAQPKAPVED